MYLSANLVDCGKITCWVKFPTLILRYFFVKFTDILSKFKIYNEISFCEIAAMDENKSFDKWMKFNKIHYRNVAICQAVL